MTKTLLVIIVMSLVGCSHVTQSKVTKQDTDRCSPSCEKNKGFRDITENGDCVCGNGAVFYL